MMIREWLFPLSAVVMTWLVWMPLWSWFSARALARRRSRARAWADVGSSHTRALLALPTLGPLLWLISSACHLLETYPVNEVCTFDEVGQCQEAFMLLGCIGLMVSSALKQSVTSHATPAPVRLDADHPLNQRVRALCASNSVLRTLRVEVVSSSPVPVYTVGGFRPRVVLDACFVEHVDDDMLLSSLCHERAHVRHRDALWHMILKLCLALNPARALLQNEYMHWRQAIEARCDQEALEQGANSLALAQSLIHATRFECGSSADCAAHFKLTGISPLSTLKLRLMLLLEGGAPPSKSYGHVWLASVLCALLLIPHLSGMNLLDLWHVQIERVHAFF